MSIATVATNIATALTARAEIDARQTLDYGEWEPVTAGETHYQLQIWQAATDRRNANAAHDVAQARVRVHHHLADPFAERTYTEGDLMTLLDALTDATWWLPTADGGQIDGVNAVLEGPEVVEAPERVGRVVTFTLAVILKAEGT